MIIPSVESLIKNDFSDFNGFGGAVVTRNKTFPIDVFKGGRNVTLGTYVPKVLYSPTSNFNYAMYRVNYEKGKTYVISFKAKVLSSPSAVDTISLYRQYPRGGVTHLPLGDGRISTTFTPTETTFTNNLYIYAGRSGETVGNRVEISELKVEVGNIPTDYSPAPEDGYDYKGDNPSYHITSTGGTSVVKVVNEITEINEVLKYKMKVKNFGLDSIMVRSINTIPRPYIESLEYKDVNFSELGKFGFRFLTRLVSQDLDLIVSNPLIVEPKYLDSLYIEEILSEKEIEKERKTLTVDGNVLEEDFINITTTVKGSIYTANMKMAEINLNGKRDLTGKMVRYKRYISSKNVDGGNEKEIDYGEFGIVSSEYNDTNKMTKLVGYDKMLFTNLPYDSKAMALTYPRTIHQILQRIATVCKLELNANTYPNMNYSVKVDLWANQSFTYRDVLDHIAQATASTIGIRFGKLELYQPIETNFTLEGKFHELKIGDKYGKVNIMNVSQEPQHYNKFKPDNAMTIPIDQRQELVFENNPILSDNMESWASTLLPLVNKLDYYTMDSKAIGYGVFEVGDVVAVNEFNTGEYYNVLITSEVATNLQSVNTNIFSSRPFSYQNQYVVETDQQRQGQYVSFTVDQLNGVIEGLIKTVELEQDKLSKLTIKVDSIDLLVQNINNGNIIPNLNGFADFFGWEGQSRALYVSQYGKLQYLSGFTYAMGFQPIPIPNSLSEYGLSFYNNGSATSAFGYVVPDVKYSFRVKNHAYKAYNIDVLEFKDMASASFKSTRFTFNSPQLYSQFSINLDNTTRFVRLKFNVTGVTPASRLELTEMMFNRGEPKTWYESADDIKSWAESRISILDKEIELNSQSINAVDGKLNNAGVNINAEDGVSIYGDKFRIMNKDRTKTTFEVDNETGDLRIDGNLSAGTVGDFTIGGGVLYTEKEVRTKFFTEADIDRAAEILRGNIEPSNQDWLDYDIDGNGVIELQDVANIRRAINGLTTNPIVIIESITLGEDNSIMTQRIIPSDGDRVLSRGIMANGGLRTRSVVSDTIYIGGAPQGNGVVDTAFEIRIDYTTPVAGGYRIYALQRSKMKPLR